MKKLKQLVGKVDGPLSTRTTSSEEVELAEHTKRTATSLFRQFGAVGFGHSREAEPTSGGAQLPRVALAEAQLDAEARLIFNKYVHARDRRGVRMSVGQLTAGLRLALQIRPSQRRGDFRDAAG